MTRSSSSLSNQSSTRRCKKCHKQAAQDYSEGVSCFSCLYYSDKLHLDTQKEPCPIHSFETPPELPHELADPGTLPVTVLHWVGVRQGLNWILRDETRRARQILQKAQQRACRSRRTLSILFFRKFKRDGFGDLDGFF